MCFVLMINVMQDPKLDVALYDRQLRVLSREAMEKITKAEVLVVGLTGLGVEFGKYKLKML